MPKWIQSKENWIQREMTEKRQILQAFWDKCIVAPNIKEIDNTKRFVIEITFPPDPKWEEKVERIFKDAVAQRINFEDFFNAFKDLPLCHIRGINRGAQLGVELPGIIVIENPQITDDDLLRLRQYMIDKSMSASISFGLPTGEVLTPRFPENQSAYFFTMHSIGKVFTGMLLLSLVNEGIISEERLNKPVEIDATVMALLSPTVQKQLQKVTLHQLMIHKADLGNYLKDYFLALFRKEPSAMNIERISDFLPFADKEIRPSDYSNLGILLVGLAIERACGRDYYDILRERVIGPTGIASCFSVHKPEHAKYNLADTAIQYMAGSPAGGFWITAEGLAKFGQWICKTCNGNPSFVKLLEKYGQEFYDAKSKTVGHSGSTASSSAYFQVSFKTGVVVAVLSDQPVMAFDLNSTVQEQLFYRPSPSPTQKSTQDQDTQSVVEEKKSVQPVM